MENEKLKADGVLRIAILCSDGAHHRYLIRCLDASFEVVLIVKEPWSAQLGAMLKRKRPRPYAWALYHTCRRKLWGLERYRRRYFDSLLPNSDSRNAHAFVSNINSSDVAELLRKAEPDVTVVMGTSILRPGLLQAAGPIILNIHGGILPWYRGNHCVFFAMLDGALDRAGSTIHFVNEGIDSGDIVEAITADAQPTETAEAVYCRAEKLAIERLVILLQSYRDGGEIPRRPQMTDIGFTFRLGDRKPHHDLVFFWRRLRARLANLFSR